MKNSLIIRFFKFIIEKFLIIYNNSALERVISSVCGFFAKKAKGSVFCNFMADSTKSGAFWKNSLVFKAISANVKFVLTLGNKFKTSLQNSKIVTFLDNILNISIRDYSKLLASVILGSLAGMAVGRGFDRVNTVLIIIFAIISVYIILECAILQYK